jgi:hypothetical protein
MAMRCIAYGPRSGCMTSASGTSMPKHKKALGLEAQGLNSFQCIVSILTGARLLHQ